MSLTQKYKFTEPTGSGYQALFQQEKLPPTFAAGGGKGNIHGCPQTPHSSSPGKSPLPAWCLWLRRLLHTSTPVLLDTATRGWQCPRPRWESPRSSFGNRQYGDPISARAPKISTPSHTTPNHKLEIPSPQLCFASRAEADPLGTGNWDFTGDQPPCASWCLWDTGGCVLMSYLVYFQVLLCLPSNFCDHRMVRALLSESSCHLHNFPASTIRDSDLWVLHGVLISSRKQSLMSQGDGSSPAPQPQHSPRTPWRGFSRQMSGNDECQVEAQLCQKYPV